MLDAFDILLLDTKRTYCLKHLHANIKSKTWKGQAIRDMLWRCSKPATVRGFNQQMENMMGLSIPCHSSPLELNPACWSRHAFNTHFKSDVLLNNIAKTFNSWMLEARDKPLLSMMEVVRRMLMNRFQSKSVVLRRQSLISALGFKSN